MLKVRKSEHEVDSLTFLTIDHVQHRSEGSLAQVAGHAQAATREAQAATREGQMGQPSILNVGAR